MLPHVETVTILPVSEALDALDCYLDAIEVALAETPRHYSGAPYLPTRRAIRASEEAFDALLKAHVALSHAGCFVRSVVSREGVVRPVDLIRNALEKTQQASELLEAHQRGWDAPAENRAGLFMLKEWMYTSHVDLRALLGPAVKLLEGIDG